MFASKTVIVQTVDVIRKAISIETTAIYND